MARAAGVRMNEPVHRLLGGRAVEAICHAGLDPASMMARESADFSIEGDSKLWDGRVTDLQGVAIWAL